MKHLAHRILSARRSLLGAGFALALAAFATTAPASAQRLSTNKGGTQWEIGIGRETRSGGGAIRVGNQGVSLDLHSHGRRGDARIPRGYDGGRYEYRNERVWVPGFDQEVWVEPVYEWRYDSCGRRHQVLVCAGYYRTVCVPGRYETRQVKVWVPAPRIEVRGRDLGRRHSPIRTHRVTYRR